MIEVKNVSVTIGKNRILQDISVTFEKGKIHGLIGRNGSGKTVLMKCICGFMKPTSGAVFVEGKQIGKDVDFVPDAGVIIETPSSRFFHRIRELRIYKYRHRRLPAQTAQRYRFRGGASDEVCHPTC